MNRIFPLKNNNTLNVLKFGGIIRYEKYVPLWIERIFQAD